MTIDRDPPVNLDHHVLEDLLVKSAAADEAAFAEYYRLTSPVINALVLTRGYTREAGESVLVSLYVTAWRRAQEFDQGSVGSAWKWTLMVLEQALAAQASELGNWSGRRPRGRLWGRSHAT